MTSKLTGTAALVTGSSPDAGTAWKPSPPKSNKPAAPRWPSKPTSPSAPRPGPPWTRPWNASGTWTSWSTTPG